MIKNIILKLSILSLIAGTAFMPQPTHTMNWKNGRSREQPGQYLWPSKEIK